MVRNVVRVRISILHFASKHLECLPKSHSAIRVLHIKMLFHQKLCTVWRNKSNERQTVSNSFMSFQALKHANDRKMHWGWYCVMKTNIVNVII